MSNSDKQMELITDLDNAKLKISELLRENDILKYKIKELENENRWLKIFKHKYTGI